MLKLRMDVGFVMSVTPMIYAHQDRIEIRVDPVKILTAFIDLN